MTDLFHSGDYVVYGIYSVCSITGTTEKEIGGNRLRYYVLKPVFQQNSTVFIPVENRKLTARLHRVLTRPELERLVDSMADQQPIWAENENERRALFQKILSEGDRIGMMRLAKTLYDRQQERLARGKRLHQSDEHLSLIHISGNHSFRCLGARSACIGIRPFRHIFLIYHSISRWCAKCNKKTENL